MGHVVYSPTGPCSPGSGGLATWDHKLKARGRGLVEPQARLVAIRLKRFLPSSPLANLMRFLIAIIPPIQCRLCPVVVFTTPVANLIFHYLLDSAVCSVTHDISRKNSVCTGISGSLAMQVLRACVFCSPLQGEQLKRHVRHYPYSRSD